MASAPGWTIDFWTPFDGSTAPEVLAVAEAGRNAHRDDLVFVHGDTCLPNWLLTEGVITGVVDWPQGRYADRRSDLVTALWSIRADLLRRGRGPVPPSRTFLDAYGYGGTIESLEPYEALDILIDRVARPS